MGKQSFNFNLLLVIVFTLFTVIFFLFSNNSYAKTNVDKNHAKSLSQETSTYPYMDTSLSFEERAKDLVSRMTLEEKVSQMQNDAPAIERLGVQKYEWWNECLHGVARAGVATVFPQAIGLASMWDPDFMNKIATAISDEARAKHEKAASEGNFGRYYGLTFWTPVINIARDPRWGRTEETYGEDPHLTSRLAVSFIEGLQGDDPKYLKLVATPKHYALNNEEERRHSGSSDADERLIMNYYLPHFKTAITEGKAWSVMCAYNAVNGIPSCANDWLLTTLLRNNWGFNGYVVSDCGAIADMYNKYPQGHGYVETPEEASSLAVKAGCELSCTFTNDYSYLVNAVKQGLISEEEIDKAVTKLFEVRFRLGMFDPPEMVKYTQIPYSVVDSQEHRQLALEAARKAIVLLKNDNILPLKKDTIKSIAVIGPNANETKFGAYSGVASKAVSPFEGIKNKVGNSVTFSKGCFIDGPPSIPSQYLVTSDPSLGEHGLKGEYFNNKDLSGEPALVRLDEEIDFNWDDNSPDWNKVYWEGFSVRWTGQFIAPETGNFEFSLYTDDGSRLYINDELLIDSWTDRGSAPEEAKGSIKLEEGKPVNIKIEYYQNGWNSTARLGSNYFTDQYMNEAVEIAKEAQLVVVVAGVAEVEEKDRMDLTLPGLQNNLIDQVSSVNKNTIVVLNAGSVVDMTKWIDKVGAVVEMWYGGEEAGTALADVLFGDYNPGGKLPITFYKSDEQLLPMDDYDITKGRTYMYLKDKPQFAFGHGLSYTTFEYSDLQVESDNKGNGKVSVVVENVGKQKGDEVVQLYIHDVARSTNDQPIKQLIGFKRTTLEPGQAKKITFYITPSLLGFYNKDLDLIVEPGDFDILVGSSSDDIRLQDKLSVNELLVVERFKNKDEK